MLQRVKWVNSLRVKESISNIINDIHLRLFDNLSICFDLEIYKSLRLYVYIYIYIFFFLSISPFMDKYRF